MAVGFKAKTQGLLAETDACRFLQEQGLHLLEKNYHCPRGEIDLIMQDQDTIVFVEVRLRNHPAYGNALESVNKTKQKKIIKTALFYLQKKRLVYTAACRFDVLGLADNKKIEWIKNAFMVE